MNTHFRQTLIPVVKAAVAAHADAFSAGGWSLTRAVHGVNGIVFRAVSELAGDEVLAVKIAARDKRQRAQREYQIIKRLSAAGLDICPPPLDLVVEDPDLHGDVLISRWLPGDPFGTPPPADDLHAWNAILDALATVHHIRPDDKTDSLPQAVVYVRHPEDMLAILRGRLSDLPHDLAGNLRREQIMALADALEARIPHQWSQPAPLALIHADTQSANMLFDGTRVRLVDWEGAGWSDPAFDIANITSAWRYFDLPDAHYDWLRAEHARRLDDPSLPERASIYALIQNVQWTVMNTLFYTRGVDRPAGTHRFPPEHHLAYQRRYYERSRRLLGLA